MATVAETIRGATRTHLLDRNGLLFGQCVSAVGWVAGTVPELTEEEGIVELPTSDASNGGVVCGAALVGRRPIYVCRYQGFMWYNAVSLVNYAAKSKQMWNQPCPVFIRAIGMEGCVGPVASHMHHSMVMRMPGIVVAAPMTPAEWVEVWEYYLKHDDPVYCSEHRLSYTRSEELPDITFPKPDITIVAIGAARLEAAKIIEPLYTEHGISCNLINKVWLKPTKDDWFNDRPIKDSGKVIVFDSDYATCGAAEHVAQQLHQSLGVRVRTYGLENRVAGFSRDTDVKTPSADKMLELVLDELEWSYDA